MKTFLLMLRLGFWANPLQRVLTCICAVLILAFNVFIIGMMFDIRVPYLHGVLWSIASHHPDTAPGVGLGFAFSLFIGGVYWRMASAPRIVRLAPHGRERLIGSMLGVVLLIALLATATHWRHWDYLSDWMGGGSSTLFIARTLLGSIAGAALVASVVAMGLFISSRSPLAALLVLIALLVPLATTGFNVPQLSGLRYEWASASGVVTLLALIWIPFAIWYLRARRISPPGWLAGGGHDVLATSLVSSAAPKSREEALQRQLLGGTTVTRFGAQWFVILGLLLGLQWLIAKAGDTEPAFSAQVMFASLCICPIVTTIVSFAAIRRSRSLWLVTASTRAEFFTCVNGILERLNAVMALVFAVWVTVLWYTLTWRPGYETNFFFVFPFRFFWLQWLGWFAINAQLAGWSRWPAATIAVAALVTLAWFSTMAMPNSRNGAVALGMLILVISIWTATFALRRQAQRRWREGDFPRAVTSTVS